MATADTGTFDENTGINTPGLSGLIGAVLGKEVKTNVNSSQDTTAQTNNATGAQSSNLSAGSTTGSTTGSTAQNTSSTTNSTSNTAENASQTGLTTQNVSGVNTNVSQGTQINDTSGTTGVTGQSHVTGGTTNDVTGTTTTDSTTRNIADTSALQDVYAKQSAGVTPDMIKAIFEEGARAAPNLIRAHADAVGTRISNNTGVASSLGDLETKLTRQVADLNRGLLSDSASTAAKIADATRATVTSGVQGQSQSAKQVQDLLTANDSNTVMKQLASAITGNTQTATNQQATTGTSQLDSNRNSTTNASSTTNTAMTGTNASTSAQNTNNENYQQAYTNSVNNQTQHVAAVSDTKALTSINTGAAKNILGALAAGVGAAALWKMATGNGFVGSVKQFTDWLKATGAPIPPSTAAELEKAAAEDAAGGLDPSFGSSDAYNQGLGINDPANVGADPNIVDTPSDNGGIFSDFGFADGGQVKGYADGGQLPIPDLLKKPAQYVPNPDADINNILNGMNVAAPAAVKALTGNSSDSNTVSTGDTGAGTGTGNTSSGTSSGGGNAGGIGGTGISGGHALGFAISAVTGNVIGLAANTLGIAQDLGLTSAPNAAAAAAAAAAANTAAVSSPVSQSTVTGVDLGPVDGPDSDSTTSNSDDGASSDSGNGNGSTSTSGDSTSDSASSTSGDSSGDSTGDGGDSYANGGSVTYDADGDTDESTQQDAMLEAMGISRDGVGGLQFNDHAVRVIHKAITQQSPQTKPKGYANGGKMKKCADGGKISGPGTGISDSIPAIGPDGQPIKVSNNEYILPADTVAHVGVDVLDKLVAATHVPADLQRAVTGE